RWLLPTESVSRDGVRDGIYLVVRSAALEPRAGTPRRARQRWRHSQRAGGGNEPNSLLKKVFEVSRCATLIQDPSARRTKDSQPSGFGFGYCASHVRFRVFQQTAKRCPLL